MLHIEEQAFATRTRLKTRDLARTCAWLDAVVSQQDSVLEFVDALDGSPDALSWMRRWATLDEAARRLFRVEQAVLAPAIEALGLRAQVVIAETCRNRLRRDLEDLRIPSWEDDGLRVQRLRLNLASHFAQQESCAYRSIARRHDERTDAALAARCLAILADPGAAHRVRPDDLPHPTNRD